MGLQKEHKSSMCKRHIFAIDPDEKDRREILLEILGA